MAQEESKEKIPAAVGFQEFTKAVSVALLRATEIRNGGELDHRITAGIWIEPNQPDPPFKKDNSTGLNSSSLFSEDFRQIETTQGINKGRIGKLNDVLAHKPDLGMRFITSLANDLTGTMGRLFELTDEERKQLQESQ